LYVRDLYDCPTIAVESFQPYLSAVNSMHADLGFDAPLVGHLVIRAKKGAAQLQNTTSDDTSRYWIPASAVSDVLALALQFPDTMDPQLLRACVFTCVQFAWFCRSDTGTAAQNRHIHVGAAGDNTGIVLTAVKQKGRRHEHWKPVYRIPEDAIDGLHTLLLACKKRKAEWALDDDKVSFWRIRNEKGNYTNTHGTAWVRAALTAVGANPPAGFKYDGHGTRAGAATAANSIGVALNKICFMADWSIASKTVHSYIHPTAPPTPGACRFFGWMVPSLVTWHIPEE